MLKDRWARMSAKIREKGKNIPQFRHFSILKRNPIAHTPLPVHLLHHNKRLLMPRPTIVKRLVDQFKGILWIRLLPNRWRSVPQGEVFQDFTDNREIGDKIENAHLPLTMRTDQRVNLPNLLDAFAPARRRYPAGFVIGNGNTILPWYGSASSV